MIPKFPQFKALERTDGPEISRFTKKYPPFSDFNFTSMWAWDTKEEVRVSKYKNNLVVKFTDYLTEKPFYSFIGLNDLDNIIEELLQLSRAENLNPQLKLVPDIIVQSINSASYSYRAEEDRDNFDYIYSTDDLVAMSGGKLRIKRKHINFFQKNFSHELKFLDLNNRTVRKELRNMFQEWADDKGSELSQEYAKHEFSAFSRFLEISKYADCFALGVISNKKLIAFAAVETISSDYGLSHFQKAINSAHKGLSDYVTREVAKVLAKKKIKWLNCEQDLGVPGLRESKTSYRPRVYLKKLSLHAL